MTAVQPSPSTRTTTATRSWASPTTLGDLLDRQAAERPDALVFPDRRATSSSWPAWRPRVERRSPAWRVR